MEIRASSGRIRCAGLGAIWIVVSGATLLPPVSAQFVTPRESLKLMSIEQLLSTQIISSSRTLQDWQTAPSALSVLTAPDIGRTGALRLAEVLRGVPGLNVSRYYGSSYAVSARGFSSASVNKMQVLMDGRSLYTPLFSGVFWEVQDTLIEDIERIEVVRGPGATLWGANAVNGVVNVVTKSARDTVGTFVLAAGGDEEELAFALRHGREIHEGVFARAYVKFIERDEQVFSTGLPAGDGMRQWQSGFRMDTERRGPDQFTLQGDVYSNAFETLGQPKADNYGWNVLGRWNRANADGSGFELQMYYDVSKRDVPRQFAETRRTVDFDVQWNFQPSPQHEIVVGGGYRDSWDRTGEVGRTFVFSPARRRLQRVTAFVQDKITLQPDRWTAYIGTKVEDNEFSGVEVQPGVRLVWTPGGSQTVWAAVSRAVRTPTRVDTESRFIPNPATGLVLIQGNPDFESESALAYELGYRVQPGPALAVDLATFFNVYDDLRTLEPTLPFGLPLVIGNGFEAETYGVELTVTTQLEEWWRVRAHVGYLHQELRLKPGSLDTSGGSFEANDPKYMATLQSLLNLPWQCELDTTVRYVDRLTNPALPSYCAVDVRLAWRPRESWELAVVGQNIFDPQHAELSGGATQPEVQRAVYVRSVWRF